MAASQIVKYLRHISHDGRMSKTIGDSVTRKDAVLLEAADLIEQHQREEALRAYGDECVDEGGRP